MKKEVFKLTEEGKKRLEEELKDLVDVQRPNNVIAIQEARAQGDLSENADYDAARDEQARIEARILEIETILKNCVIINANDADSVEVGKTITIEFLDRKEVREYALVGTIEADPFNGKISDASALGAELTKTIVEDGKAKPKYHKGDVVTYVTEKGKAITIKVLDVVVTK